MGAATSASLLGCASSEDSDREGPEGASIWDVFDVGDRLGSGNFGEVRACHRRRSVIGGKEELAVKIVDKQSASVKAAEAFQTARDELDIMSGLNHPNVVELKQIFEDERFLYVVMELVPGGELFQAISNKKCVVYEDDISHIAQQTFDALDYLHGLNIVHRDIKAQNMLLTKRPEVPGRALQTADVKLIDFGLATRIRQDCLMGSEAQLDLVCGTPAMCAPEIWAAQDQAPTEWKRRWGMTYGFKVDVWAAGVVLYMALFGRLPFHERFPKKLAQRVCDPNDEINFKSKNFQVSPSCQKFLGSVLEKDQTRRISSTQACRDGWLTGRNARGARTRGLSLQEIPHEESASRASRRSGVPVRGQVDDSDDPDARSSETGDDSESESEDDAARGFC